MTQYHNNGYDNGHEKTMKVHKKNDDNGMTTLNMITMGMTMATKRQGNSDPK